MSKKIMELTSSISFFSPNINKLPRSNSSIQINMSGNAVFDCEIQQSLDGINFATVDGSLLTGVDATSAPLIYDLNTGSPSVYRVLVTINSGSGDFEIYAN